jgi:hypothetical protein
VFVENLQGFYYVDGIGYLLYDNINRALLLDVEGQTRRSLTEEAVWMRAHAGPNAKTLGTKDDYSVRNNR